MQHNDLGRTGWDSSESILDDSNVRVNGFGKLFTRAVDDQIYAQPLVVSSVSLEGGFHNIVLVATVNNSVYAFDADDPALDSPYWKVNLTAPGLRAPRNSDMTGACGGGGAYHDFTGKIGIVGTPALDTAHHLLYVVARSVGLNGTGFVQYLHALDYRTGSEKPGSPVLIQAEVPGQGNGSVNGIISFDPQLENQRPGLLLCRGVVFICWASHCDWGNYHGWVMGYDAATLQQEYVYNVTPNGYMGGIWMSGQAPAVDDSGYIYLTTGNGSEGIPGDPAVPGDRSEALLKMSLDGGRLGVKDFFTPDDFASLDSNDLDYGCDGVLLIPGTRLSLSGSKQSFLYLVNVDHMGGISSEDSGAVQILDVNAESPDADRHIHGSPVYFRDSRGREWVYAWAEDGLLKQYPFLRESGKFDLGNVVIGTEGLPYGEPGAMLGVSSLGSRAGTGILWASHPYSGDANYLVVPGVLQAYDATDVTHKLWDSNQDPDRDRVGNFAKFVSPVVANGKVYLATFSNQLDVYGLNPPASGGCPDSLPAPWKSTDIGSVTFPGGVCDNQGLFTLKASGADIWNNLDDFHYVYQGMDTSQMMITARVEYLDYTDPWAKCGVMIRQSLDAGSPQVLMCLTAGNGLAFQDRISDQGSSSSSDLPNLFYPYWVRLIRDGNEFSGYVSGDGSVWTAVDSVAIAMTARTDAGIAFASHNINLPGNALVDSVSIQKLDFSTAPGAGGKVYPNPASYQVFFSDSAFTAGDAGIQVELLDGSGRLVLEQPGTREQQGPAIRISLPPGLPNGYYFMRLVNSRGAKEVRKLLILR